MTIRSTVPRLLLAAACSGAVLYGPAAPTAFATVCPGGTVTDQRTGICWSQSQGNITITGTGGVCMPGRLGLCLGALQNSQIPGATLPAPSIGATSRPGSWP
jgi:hypothetical protein